MFWLTGCATRPYYVLLFEHPPIYPKGIIETNVGVELFQDLRPKKEKELTKSIENIAEEITAIVTRDLRDAELFKSIKINYSPEEVDLILTGEINSFYWKSVVSPTTKLPYVKYIHYLGLTSGEGEGEVELTFIIKNARTGEEIKRYKEYAKMVRKYNVYQAKSVGGETARALRQVIEKFMEDILKDKEEILKKLKPCECKD
jgi:hypothetical protein